MPIPAIALAPLLETIGVWLSRYLMAKAALWMVKIAGVIGLSVATHQYAVEPLLDYISGNMGSMPSTIRVWFGAFGIDQVLSILVSAYSVAMTKKAFFQMTNPGAGV